MSQFATITITSGPDRGRVFELREEMHQIGMGDENEVGLNDTSLAEQQAVIAQRNGRFALCTPIADEISVDGKPVPAGQWVWLPDVARVRLNSRTAFQFNTGGGENTPVQPLPAPGSTAQPENGPAPVAPPKAKPVPKRKRSRNEAKPKSKQEQVAQFLTNSRGDALVQLGEDGHLPELHLSDAPNARSRQPRKKSDTKVGLYLLLGFSVVSSMGLALLDLEPANVTQSQRGEARREIREYYPSDGSQPARYQEYLLEARLAQARGDRSDEVRAYRRVLDLLNAEDNNPFSGLTGNLQQDRRLRELIGIIIHR